MSGEQTGVSSGSSPAPISILIVDDHPVVQEGLSAMLSAEPGMKVVGAANSGEQGVAAYFNLRPDVVLMDLMMPDIRGSEAIARICAKSNGARIIVVTTLDGDEEIYRALEAGARGYLLKDMVRKELFNAIREVYAGRRYIPAEVGATIAKNLPRPNLSSREVEVLQLIASGMRNKEIAYALDVSEATVNSHVKHILSKLNVTDRTHAVVVALKRGVIHL